MNKKVASEIAVGVILILVIVIGGIFWMQNRESVSTKQALLVVSQQSNNQQKVIEEPRQQEIQNVVTSGYKVVQVNNPKIHFSFEVPENWMTETRNSGDKALTTEEKRSFMMDNLQPDKDYYAKMSSKNIESNFKKYQKELFPIASVADYKYVSYSDTNWQQVDFTVAENVKSMEAINNLKNNSCKSPCETCKDVIDKKYGRMSSCDDSPNNCTTGQQQVSGFDSNFIKMGISVYDGKQNADKLCSGGSVYYVPVTNAIALKISKQAQGDEQYEKDFEHMIQTLKIGN